MSVAKNNGPIVDPALCRCCRAIKKCRILTAEYTWMGKKEIYADMVMDCYGILLSHVDDNEKDSGVCATCVVRLREAIAFRHQVLQCEELFLQAKLEPDHHEDEKEEENKLKKLDLELKTEPKDYSSDHNSVDERDNEPLPTYSEDENDDNKPLKAEESKPGEPQPLKDEDLKSEDSVDYNGDSTSDSDEPIKKKMKRKTKTKANGAKKKSPKTTKKQKAENEVTEAKDASEASNLEIAKMIVESIKRGKMDDLEENELTISTQMEGIPNPVDSIALPLPLKCEEETVEKKHMGCCTPASEDREYQRLLQKLEADESLYFKHYNMSKSSLEELHEMLEPTIEKMHTNYGNPILSREQLAVCLRYLRTGDSFTAIAQLHGIDTSTVTVIITGVAKAIWDILQPIYMPLPTQEMWLQFEAGFKNVWGFPNCIGSVTGKHIVLKNFFDNPEDNPTPALLAIVDPFYNFVAIDIDDYDEESEGNTLEYCELYKQYFRNGFVLPAKNLPGIERMVPRVLIGDSGFNLKSYLMRAYTNHAAAKNLTKTSFNDRLVKARTSDVALALLLDNWRVFQRPLECHLHTAVHLVKAACCLHNFLRIKHGSIPDNINLKIEKYNKSSKTSMKGLSPFEPSNHRGTKRALIIREHFAKYFSNTQNDWSSRGVSGDVKVEKA